MTVCILFTPQIKGAVAFHVAVFGAGSGAIYLDEVHCTGSETALLACPSSPIGLHDCNHNEDASVACTGDLVNC